MLERGVVQGIEDGLARIRIRVESAEACASCKVCAEEPDGRYLTAEALPGVQIGSRVEVTVPDDAALGPAVVVFLLPVVSIIVGAGLGSHMPTWLNRSDYSETLFGILGAMLLLACSALAIRWYDRSFRKSSRGARVVRILD